MAGEDQKVTSNNKGTENKGNTTNSNTSSSSTNHQTNFATNDNTISIQPIPFTPINISEILNGLDLKDKALKKPLTFKLDYTVTTWKETYSAGIAEAQKEKNDEWVNCSCNKNANGKLPCCIGAVDYIQFNYSDIKAIVESRRDLSQDQKNFGFNLVNNLTAGKFIGLGLNSQDSKINRYAIEMIGITINKDTVNVSLPICIYSTGHSWNNQMANAFNLACYTYILCCCNLDASGTDLRINLTDKFKLLTNSDLNEHIINAEVKANILSGNSLFTLENITYQIKLDNSFPFVDLEEWFGYYIYKEVFIDRDNRRLNYIANLHINDMGTVNMIYRLYFENANESKGAGERFLDKLCFIMDPNMSIEDKNIIKIMIHQLNTVTMSEVEEYRRSIGIDVSSV